MKRSIGRSGENQFLCLICLSPGHQEPLDEHVIQRYQTAEEGGFWKPNGNIPGAAIGGIFIASRKGLNPYKLVSASLMFGLTVLGAAFMPSSLLSGLALVLVGFSSINFSSLDNSTLQLVSSPQMRGRVMSFWSMAFLGSTTIGGPIVGWFAESAGARWGLALGGLAALIAAALGAITLRKLRTDSTVMHNEHSF